MEHKKIIQKIVKQFAKNESNNFHSENTVLLAENFGTDEDVVDAKRILNEHHRIGYIPYNMLQERGVIYKKCYPQLAHWMGVYKIPKR